MQGTSEGSSSSSETLRPAPHIFKQGSNQSDILIAVVWDEEAMEKMAALAELGSVVIPAVSQLSALVHNSLWNTWRLNVRANKQRSQQEGPGVPFGNTGTLLKTRPLISADSSRLKVQQATGGSCTHSLHPSSSRVLIHSCTITEAAADRDRIYCLAQGEQRWGKKHHFIMFSLPASSLQSQVMSDQVTLIP